MNLGNVQGWQLLVLWSVVLRWTMELIGTWQYP
jgi:hypothetical protein